MHDFLNKLNDYFRGEGVALVRGITIVLLGYMIIKAIIKTLKKSLNRSQTIEKTLPNFFISLLNIILMACLVIYALTLVGVSSDSVVTIASVFSLGVSLALQDTISSLANGIIIIVTKPFVEGEFVSIDGADGTIVSISMFNTVLKTARGQMITLPNSSITKNNVTNYTRLPTRRIDIQIPVSYRSKTEEVKKTVLEVVANQKGILRDPAPTVRLDSLGDSNLNYILKCWVPGDIYWDTIFDLNEKILDALNDANISIDYQQCDIRIKEFPNMGKENEK